LEYSAIKNYFSLLYHVEQMISSKTLTQIRNAEPKTTLTQTKLIIQSNKIFKTSHNLKTH